jgi:transposase
MRDRCRAREDALRELNAAKWRLQAFVRRHAIRSTGPATWQPAPLRWRSAVGCPTPAQHLVLQAYVRAVNEHPARLQRLAPARNAYVHTWRFQPVVDALQALRGVQCTVAVTTVAARGELTRFDTPRQRRDSLGFTPSASSRGPRRRQGAIPKTGQSPARRALGEGAWASRSPATVSRHGHLRRAKPSKVLQEISGKAQGRLCQRYRPRRARGNNVHQVVVAIARALLGCLWAMAQEVPVPP